MMANNSVKLIVQPPFTHEDAWDLGAKVRWNWHDECEETDKSPYYIDWYTLDPPVSIRFIDAPNLMVSYFLLTGDDLDEAISEIRAGARITERADCLKIFERNPSATEVQHALGTLRLLAPPTVDSEILAVFRQALTHPNPDVRYIALWAVPDDWDEIVSIVQQMVTDNDPKVREVAQHSLDYWRLQAEQPSPQTPDEQPPVNPTDIPTQSDMRSMPTVTEPHSPIERNISVFVAFRKRHPVLQCRPVPDESIAKYTGKLPEPLLQLWREDGWCAYSNGLLWFVNPADYDDILDAWFEEPENMLVFARSSFGDLLIWNDEAVYQLCCHHPASFEHLSNDITQYLDTMMIEDKHLEDNFYLSRHMEAMERFGPLTAGENYSYIVWPWRTDFVKKNHPDDLRWKAQLLRHCEMPKF
jgi:hypothetical protein